MRKLSEPQAIRWRAIAAAWLLMMVAAAAATVAPGAAAEQASDPSSPTAGVLSTGAYDTCAVLQDGSLRCWGLGSSGQLGYDSTNNVGDLNTPASVAPVNLGGHTVKAVATGSYHTCAILDGGSVRCWGFGGDGRLGYGNTNNVLDPSTAAAVNLGVGRTARAITAGSDDTCVILDTGGVEIHPPLGTEDGAVHLVLEGLREDDARPISAAVRDQLRLGVRRRRRSTRVDQDRTRVTPTDWSLGIEARLRALISEGSSAPWRQVSRPVSPAAGS